MTPELIPQYFNKVTDTCSGNVWPGALDASIQKRRLHENDASTVKESISTTEDKDSAILEPTITPPNSIVRGGSTRTIVKGELDGPLSPGHSSPIQYSKPKRTKTDGVSRNSGGLTVSDLTNYLTTRQANNMFQSKPPYSYATLISIAILQSKEGKLTLSQIYNWITRNFPFYKMKDASWQNSIRHNLSLNHAFLKTSRSNDGKGHYWEVPKGMETRFFRKEGLSYDELREALLNISLLDNSEPDLPFNDGSDLTSDRPHDCNLTNKTPDSFIVRNDETIETSQLDFGTPLYYDYEHWQNSPSFDVIASTPQKVKISGLDHDERVTPKDHTTIQNTISDSYKSSLAPPCILNRAPTELCGAEFHHETTSHGLGNCTSCSIQDRSLDANESHQGMKKYMGSFNSCFDLSPYRDTLDIARTPTDFDESSKYLEPNSANLKSDVGGHVPQAVTPTTSNIEITTSDTEKTPILRSCQDLSGEVKQTPLVKIHDGTPAMLSTAFKRLSNSPNLFEEMYSSPLYKALSSPSNACKTQNKTRHIIFSPKLGGLGIAKDGQSFSLNGLFGVDICSVLKRATEPYQNLNSETQHGNNPNP